MGRRCIKTTQRRRVGLQGSRPGNRAGSGQGARVLVNCPPNDHWSAGTSKILVALTGKRITLLKSCEGLKHFQLVAQDSLGMIEIGWAGRFHPLIHCHRNRGAAIERQYVKSLTKIKIVVPFSKGQLCTTPSQVCVQLFLRREGTDTVFDPVHILFQAARSDPFRFRSAAYRSRLHNPPARPQSPTHTTALADSCFHLWPVTDRSCAIMFRRLPQLPDQRASRR